MEIHKIPMTGLVPPPLRHNKWIVDEPLKLVKGDAFTSMVIYKDINVTARRYARYYNVKAEDPCVLNLAIGRTSIHVVDKNGCTVFVLAPFKATYEKEIYKPCKIELQMHVTDGDRKVYVSELQDMFLKREIELTLVTWEAQSAKYISIAQSCFVQSLHLYHSHNSGQDTVATFTCYSPDYKMTLDKFCQAFNSKRLGMDIFREGTAKFNGVGEIDLDVNRLMFIGYDKTPGEVTSRDELLQPYLMQYNESFYDFLCRTANRCGEFLYYEDGALHLGLPEATRHAVEEKPSDIPTLVPYSVTYPDLPAEIDTGLDTKTYFYDPAVGDSEDKKQEPQYFGSGGGEADDYSELKDISIDIFRDAHFVISALSAFAMSNSTAAALSNTLTNIIRQLIIYKSNYYMGALKGSQDALDALKKNVEKHPLSKNTVQLINDISQQFYSQIKDCEQEAAARKIVMDFDNTMPDTQLAKAFTLGDGICEAYVVTKMMGELTLEFQNHSVEAVPRLEDPNERLSRDNDNRYALIVPPYMDTPEIGTKPMEAIVKDARDPFKLGRVRVAFLWQDQEEEAWSKWIPLATPFTGNGESRGGFFMMPEAGSHVIVDFINHDPNNPYVVGSVYNKNQGAPGYEFEYDTTSATSQAYNPNVHVQTIKSTNGHGITFFDGSDIHFLEDNAIPLIGQIINTVSASKAKEGESLDLKNSWDTCKSGGMILSDTSGLYSIKMNSRTRSIDINSPLGNVSLGAFTGITVSAPNGDVRIEGKNVTIAAGNNLTLRSGGNIKMPGQDGVGMDFVKGFINQNIMMLAGDAAGYLAQKTGFSITKAFDLSFLRASWEVLMRPVEGTLSISTPRNITMTAGLGKNIIPVSLMSDAKTIGGSISDITTPKSNRSLAIAKEEQQPLARIKKMLEMVKSGIDEFYEQKKKLVVDLLKKLDSVHHTKLTYNNILKDYVKLQIGNAQELQNVISDNTIFKKPQKLYGALPDNALNLIDTADATQKITDAYSQLDPASSDAQKDIDALEVINQVIRTLNECIELKKNAGKDCTAELAGSISGKIKEANKRWKLAKSLDVASINKTIQIFEKPASDYETFLFDSSSLIKPTDVLGINVKNRNEVAIDIYTTLIKQLDYYLKLKPKKDAVKQDKLSDVKAEDYSDWIDRLAATSPKDRQAMDGTLKNVVNTVAGIALADLAKLTHADEIPKLLNWNGCAGPRSYCDITNGGSIFLSNNGGVTYTMKESGNSFEAKINETVEPIVRVLKTSIQKSNAPDGLQQAADAIENKKS